MCVLFILGRDTDLDTVSMLAHILIGTHSSFFPSLLQENGLCVLQEGQRFSAAVLPQLSGKNPRSHHKGVTGRVQTGNQVHIHAS